MWVLGAKLRFSTNMHFLKTAGSSLQPQNLSEGSMDPLLESKKLMFKEERGLPRSHSQQAVAAEAQVCLPPQPVRCAVCPFLCHTHRKQEAGLRPRRQHPQGAAVTWVVKEPLTMLLVSALIHLFNTKCQETDKQHSYSHRTQNLVEEIEAQELLESVQSS